MSVTNSDGPVIADLQPSLRLSQRDGRILVEGGLYTMQGWQDFSRRWTLYQGWQDFSQWLKYKIGGGGSLSISGPQRDPADIFRCIVDVNWAPDLSIVKFMGPGSQIRQDPAYFNHCMCVNRN